MKLNRFSTCSKSRTRWSKDPHAASETQFGHPAANQSNYRFAHSR